MMAGAGVLDRRERVRDDEGAEGDADDDNELPRLEYYPRDGRPLR